MYRIADWRTTDNDHAFAHDYHDTRWGGDDHDHTSGRNDRDFWSPCGK